MAQRPITSVLASTALAVVGLLAATTLSATEEPGAVPAQPAVTAPPAQPDTPAPPVQQPAAAKPEQQPADAKPSQQAGDAASPDAVAQTADLPPGAVKAIWKQQQISFYFTSFTTYYACASLEDRIESLLKALGARAKVQVRSPDCPTRVATMPHVMVDVTSPVEATPQAIADRDKNKSTRELAARVQGKRPDQIEGLEEFPAQWKRLSLGRGKLSVEPGDCELIDELRRKVLPKLGIRVVDNDVQCMPHQLSLTRPRLEVEALVALPKPDTKEEPKKETFELNLRTE